MSNCTKTPELYKIAFLPQLSELTTDLFDVRFERGRATPAVLNIISRLQSHVAHFTVFKVRFCGPVFF